MYFVFIVNGSLLNDTEVLTNLDNLQWDVDFLISLHKRGSVMLAEMLANFTGIVLGDLKVLTPTELGPVMDAFVPINDPVRLALSSSSLFKVMIWNLLFIRLFL